ncbi:MAG: hypothetical protein WAW42_17630 [Candidatus Competibacteraceae bacterium]
MPKAWGNGFGPPAFFAEQALQQIRGPHRLAVGDAGLEVVLEAGHRARELPRIAPPETRLELENL